MKSQTSKAPLVVRIVVAVVLLLGLLAVAGADLAPTVPRPLFLGYAALVGLALVAIVVVAAVGSLTVLQFVLRHGGTDPQWFWFGSEPRGLRNLRLQANELAERQRRGEPS